MPMRVYYRDLNGVLIESPQIVEAGKGRKGPHLVPGAPDHFDPSRSPKPEWRAQAEYTYDLDLGDDHWLCWSVGTTGQVAGGSIMHKTPKTETGWCEGAFNVAVEGYGTAVWEWNGSLERPTVRASLLCGCGDHGYITDGRWGRG